MENEDIYRKKECEICHAFAYEKYLGTAKVLDGGFTRIENWENSGFGSVVINFWEFKHLKSSRAELKLCPACAGRLDKAIFDAISEMKRSAEDDK